GARPPHAETVSRTIKRSVLKYKNDNRLVFSKLLMPLSVWSRTGWLESMEDSGIGGKCLTLLLSCKLEGAQEARFVTPLSLPRALSPTSFYPKLDSVPRPSPTLVH